MLYVLEGDIPSDTAHYFVIVSNVCVQSGDTFEKKFLPTFEK